MQLFKGALQRPPLGEGNIKKKKQEKVLLLVVFWTGKQPQDFKCFDPREKVEFVLTESLLEAAAGGFMWLLVI